MKKKYLPRGWSEWGRFKNSFAHDSGASIIFITTECSPEGFKEYVVRVMVFSDQECNCSEFSTNDRNIFINFSDAYDFAIDEMKKITRFNDKYG
jgi:hypothetical protein